MTQTRPQLLIFDVNETLSDMAPLAERFVAVGAPAGLAATWFASLLRDGFALTAAGAQAPFAEIARGCLDQALAGVSDPAGPGGGDRDAAVEHVLAGIAELSVHEDVATGIPALAGLGIELVTLSNGAASVAETLLEGVGLRDRFAALLSVEDAGAWKPAPAAYEHALRERGVAAADAMLVAVHPWDTDGARRAGLQAAWINRAGGAYPGHFEAPDIEATSLLDLAERLG